MPARFTTPSRLLLAGFLLAAGQAEAIDVSYDGKAIRYALEAPDVVTVEVTSPGGRHGATVWAGPQAEGPQNIPWSGSDDDGQPLPAGEYVLAVRVGRTAVRDAEFGGKGFVSFTNPTCVRVDGQGNVYVVDLDSKGPAVGTGSGSLRKVGPDGTPVADFLRWPGARPDEPQMSFLGLPRFAVWAEIADDRTIFYNDKNTVAIVEYHGKRIRNIGGYEWLAGSDGKLTARTGSAWPLFGMALGEGNKVYVRDQRAIRAYDRTKPAFEAYLYSSPEDLDLPPARGVWIGPCIASDRRGRIYCTGLEGLSRWTDAGGKIRGDYRAAVRFRECMGLAMGRDGTIYVADRGLGMEPAEPPAAKPGALPKPVPRVYQFWDDGRQLRPVWHLEDRELAGLHDVAISPDGTSLYLVEDTANFALRGAVAVWPQRNLQGKGRLWKYNLSHKGEARKTIRIP